MKKEDKELNKNDDLLTREGLINEMISVYLSNNDDEKNSFACESKIKQLSTIFKVITDNETYEREHNKEAPIEKVEIEFVDSETNDIKNDIQALENQLANELHLTSKEVS